MVEKENQKIRTVHHERSGFLCYVTLVRFCFGEAKSNKPPAMPGEGK